MTPQELIESSVELAYISPEKRAARISEIATEIQPLDAQRKELADNWLTYTTAQWIAEVLSLNKDVKIETEFPTAIVDLRSKANQHLGFATGLLAQNLVPTRIVLDPARMTISVYTKENTQ